MFGYVLIWVVVYWGVVLCGAVTSVGEVQALKEFYVVTSGPSWFNSSGWTGIDPCDEMWFGVFCDTQKRTATVTSIVLTNNGLSGTIPSSLTILSNLKELLLNGNSLSGSLPDLSALLSLNNIDVSFNSLDGGLVTFPMNIQFISVAYNQLVGEIPTHLALLSHLSSLYLGGNRFSGSIPELSSLMLHTFQVEHNYLTGTAPTFIGNMSSLAILDLSWNSLTGTIPSQYSNLTQLESFQISGNQIEGTMDEILFILSSSLSNLKILAVEENILDGTLPQLIGIYTNLQVLNVQKNKLFGTIPSEIGCLSHLYSFFVEVNKFNGTIPTTIGNLQQLSYLYLGGNDFSGTIPQEIVLLTTLIELDMGGNHFSGTIPQGFLNLPHLQILDMHDNKLIGTIPNQLGRLTNIINFYLSQNNFTGTIPDFLDTAQIQDLRLEDNFLTGTIPSSIGNLLGLIGIDLSNNQLSGTIPSSFSYSPMLNSFSIASNPNLCDECFRFKTKKIDSCNAEGIAHNCPCDFTPCGNSICLVSTLCLCTSGVNQDCQLEDVVINSDELNILKRAVLSNINLLIHGDLKMSSIDFLTSNVTVQGSLEGTDSFLGVQESTLLIYENLNLTSSTILFGGQSFVKVLGIVKLVNTSIILDLNQSVPNEEIVLIQTQLPTSWPTVQVHNSPPMPCRSPQQKSSETSLTIVYQSTCSSISPAIIGGIVGGVLLLSILLLAFLIHRRRSQMAKEVNKLQNKLEYKAEL